MKLCKDSLWRLDADTQQVTLMEKRMMFPVQCKDDGINPLGVQSQVVMVRDT